MCTQRNSCEGCRYDGKYFLEEENQWEPDCKHPSASADNPVFTGMFGCDYFDDGIEHVCSCYLDASEGICAAGSEVGIQPCLASTPCQWRDEYNALPVQKGA